MSRVGRLTALAGIGLLLAAPTASARDAVVESFDGTPIVAHFFPAPGLAPGQRAPTLMIGHGWGGTGATSPPEEYAAAGYNVLTWDARGFGGSGGSAMIDHPEFEGRDAQALIDFVTQQPEAALDAPGDPRLGMDGPSYGGGVQFITAARDSRVDAIAPTIAWNSLHTSLYKSSSVKSGWGAALVGVGIPTSALLGVFSPAGVQTGHQSEQFYNLLTWGLGTGRFRPEEVAWLDEHGPSHLLEQIKAPTLIAQGTVDTLFTLDEAHRNFSALKANGVPVKMIWFCGGHGACLTETDAGNPISTLAGDSGRVQGRKLAWFARHLKGDAAADVGPEFEWIDEEGDWHESAAYPLDDAGSVSGSGSGTIPLVPGVHPSGVLVFATESPAGGMTVPIAAPPAGAHVLGEPHLSLSYRATGFSTASDGRTHVFAQLIDRSRTSPLVPGTNLVVGNQATPVPIELDGQPHEVEIPLERVASKATAAGYELQLIPQSTLYDFQRAAGLVEVENASVTLPISQAVGAAPAPPAARSGKRGKLKRKCKRRAKRVKASARKRCKKKRR